MTLERCLACLRDLSDELANDLLTLSPEAWEGPTNCPPWRVRDLAAHVVVSGEGFVGNVRRGLTGSAESAPDTERSRQWRQQMEAAAPTTLALALRETTNEFIALYNGLSDAQLEAICFHRRGNRSVRWYAAHRLAEVAFHSWDFQLSTGRTPTLREDVAALLLPTLLESNLPRTYAAGLSKQRGSGERYLLVVAGDPSARWLVTIAPEELQTRREDAPADVAITASASTLALLVYGRQELRSMLDSGDVQVEGEAALVDRFASIFPRP